MPDFNADKEFGIGKRKWIVQAATKNIATSVKTGKGELKLDKKGRALISDEVLAREIQKDHRRDMAVSRIFVDDPADRGHCYFWGSWPEMPWKRKEAEGDPGPEPEAESKEVVDDDDTFHGEGVA